MTHGRLAVLALVAGALAPAPVAAQAAAPPLIARAALFGNPERAQPQLSPDGTRLAYLAPDNGVLNVWVRSLGTDDARVVTSDTKRGIRFFAWQRDGRHIIYRQDRDGDENWHIYQTNLETRSTRDLTPFEGIQAQFVASEPDQPDTLLVALNVRDKTLHDVYRVNLRDGTSELDTENPGDVSGWSADHTLTVRVAQAYGPDGGTVLRVRDDAKAPWRELTKWGPDETFGGVAAIRPDGKGVYLISSLGANAARLTDLDFATGQSRVVAADPQYDVNDVMTHPTSHVLEAVEFVRARSEWQPVDKALEADFAALQRVRKGDFKVESRDVSDRVWVVSYLADDAPVYYHAFDRASRKATALFSNRPQLERQRLAEMRPISFKARDGLLLHGYLTLPAGSAGKNLPMVVNVHGGPWGRDTWGLDNEAQWLANRGYAVLQVNFRGSTGYGKQYLNAGDREWAGAMHTDLLDGKKWAIEQGHADPAKVAVMGGSYGGYATLVGVAFTPGEFACGVDIVGPSNLETLLKSIPPYWKTLASVFQKRMGRLEETEFLKSRSPLYKAGDIKVPLLIAQGANDPRVKQAESDQIVEAMRKNGKPVDYYVFPDEGHGFARPENRMAFYAAAEQFLARCLGGRAEPPSEAEAKLLASIKK
jgi:dipeptidyl aminopeptidase/acylaminoacyl peptidase